MAEVDDPIDGDMEYQSSTFKSDDIPVIGSEDNFYKVDIQPIETAGVKKKYSKGPKRPQQKKELYTKLDEILFAALRQEFEVSPGCTIDRLDMVKFLTSAVHQHLSDCPDLDQLLNLRDTVLTGRVKKVFPEVEYRRKQIKQDHYRKAWLYVNIRRKPSRITHHGEVKIVTVSSTRTWTPPVAPGSAPVSHASSSPSSPASEDQLPSPHAYTNTTLEHCSSNADSAGSVQCHESEQCSGSDAVPSISPQFSIGCGASERAGVVFDNSTLQKWVLSNYVQDNIAYVPVQDVVKAFKRDFGVDISYKECHQMILSAYTSPKNRLIPKKNVRVSSIGQQYVYRGIAAVDKPACTSVESQGVDESECAQSNYQSGDSQGESEENWKQRISEITAERDQALNERNQALAALMELEKDHAEALGTIERLKRESSCSRCVENSPKTFKEVNNSMDRETSANHREVSSFGNLFRRFGDAKRDLLSHNDKNSDRLQDKCDFSFLKEVVTQAKDERDNLLRRLEVVKTERNSYLERLHSFEKENQRLKDAVGVRDLDQSRNRWLDDISMHFQTNCHGENDTKEAIGSVLAHLKSKRKQVAPSRLNKSPKFDHANVNEQNRFEDQKTLSGDCQSPSGAADSGIPSPENTGVSNGDLVSEKESGLLNSDIDKTSRNTSSEETGSKQDLLVFTSGSGMIGFTRHPLED